MAEKDKVPVVAIRQIVKMRHDEYHKYSYQAIAKRLKDDFQIEVTPQAVGYLYRKYKDTFAHNQNTKAETLSTTLTQSQKDSIAEFKKPILNSNKQKEAITLKRFDNGDIDLDKFF